MILNFNAIVSLQHSLNEKRNLQDKLLNNQKRNKRKKKGRNLEIGNGNGIEALKQMIFKNKVTFP